MATRIWKEVTKSSQAYPPFSAKCSRCGEPLQSDRSQSPSMWADLAGTPWVYYCGTCVNQLEWGKETGDRGDN